MTRVSIAATGLISLSLAACQTAQTPAPSVSTIRQDVQTAPADLQLLCASEAATRYGADSSRVLPTASSVVQPGLYRVELNVAGSPAVCTIDDNGAVHSIG